MKWSFKKLIFVIFTCVSQSEQCNPPLDRFVYHWSIHYYIKIISLWFWKFLNSWLFKIYNKFGCDFNAWFILPYQQQIFINVYFTPDQSEKKKYANWLVKKVKLKCDVNASVTWQFLPLKITYKSWHCLPCRFQSKRYTKPFDKRHSVVWYKKRSNKKWKDFWVTQRR